MTIYKYVGRTSKGQMKKGTIDAVNQKEAMNKLREKGISPREINEAKGIMYAEINLGGTSVKQEDFVIYCRQFATLIRAGVSVVQSTNILSRQSESKALQKALTSIEEDLRSGISYSEAAKKHPKIFPPIFVNLVKAGEATGNLDSTLDRLANNFEKQYTTKKKVQSALAYPLVILAITILVVIFLMVSIIPSFAGMFEGMGAELPGITKFMMNLSDAIVNWWWLLVLIIGLAVFGFMYLLKTNKDFHYQTNVFLLKMPAFGKLIQKSAISEMSRTLASLVASSVPILQSLSIVEKVVNNPVIGKVILEARDALENGNRLSEPFSRSWVIPPLVTQMIAIGEETGSLDYMLGKVADFYEAEVDRAVDTIKSLIEPIMIVFLAVVVGTVVLSIIVPMFSIFQQV